MAGNIGEELLLVHWRSAINSLLGVASGFTRACVKKQCFDTSRRLTKTQHQIILLPSCPRNIEHAAEIFLST